MPLTLTSHEIESGMAAAIAQARCAAATAEVPVGAIIFKPSVGIISQAGNQVEELNDATAHAEMLAIRAASHTLSNWRLEDCALFVTLEPCTMCMGAIRNARVGALIYGASDPRAGAAGSLYDLSLDPRLGKMPRVISGINAEECADIMKKFFDGLR